MTKTSIFPLTHQPLVHSITNEITCETVANALLAVDAKPVMADDPRDVASFLKQSAALLINLGKLSVEHEEAFRVASKLAPQYQKPVVIDVVGITASPLRYQLLMDLMTHQPAVVKGNMSELRKVCQLPSHGKGVDASSLDQNYHELIPALKKLCHTYPKTTFLATGEKDVIVNADKVTVLANGCPQLDRFTGTGDVVGAIIAALLGSDYEAFDACYLATSYFNICGEIAHSTSRGLAEFRLQTINQLSLLADDNPNWQDKIKVVPYEN